MILGAGEARARRPERGGDDPGPAARMHTAEHLLTAVMREAFGSSGIVESHLGPRKTKCDYLVDRSIGPADLVRIAAAVNAEIAADRPVRVRVVSRAEASGFVDLSRTPPKADPIRIVEIEGIDATPCAAQHVERTGQIGRFVLRSAERRDERTVRLRFTLESAGRTGAVSSEER